MRTLYVVILGAFLANAIPIAQGRATEIQTPDQLSLKGTVYSKSGRQGPGLLLLHDCDSDQRSYSELAEMLSTVGYHVLTFDYLGVGLSKAAGFTDFASQRD